MKKILVPTDFSPNASKAIDFAVEIAVMSRAAITLLYVHNLVDTPFRDKTILEKKYGLPMEEAAVQELEQVCGSIRNAMHIEIGYEMYGGTVADSILEAVKDNGVDLVIMGTLGDTGFKEKLVGSITAEIISKADIPVMAVPLLSEWETPKNILLAVNHFDEQPGNARPVFDLARLFNARITVAVFTNEDKASALQYMENSRGIYSYDQKLESLFRDVQVEPAKLFGHHFQDSIDEYIGENRVDMLAMFTHKRNFVESIFNRSISKKMSYHTNIPLLTIPVNNS